METTKEEVVKTATSTVNDFRKMAPKAGVAPKIEVGSADHFTLDNGLKVFVVENHKLPRVSFQIFVDVPPFMEKESVGTASIAGQLLRSGTSSKSKAVIDETIDFMGASLNTNSNGLYGASLKKHTESLMEIAADILLKPSFPQTEFDKIKKQTLSNLAQSKEDADAIAGNVSTVLRYGKDHPYGEVESEETVAKITLDKAKEYYKTYLQPNIAYMIVVGDITQAEAAPLVKKYFGNWNKKAVAKGNFAKPTKPTKPQIGFVSKSGAAQSVIRLTYPVDIKPGSKDWIPARIMNAILGGSGLSSRINQNLREDKAYTYGGGSTLSNDPLIGYFSASVSVRNEVTVPAIKELLKELNRMRTEKVSAKELTQIKNYLTGRFSIQLESPQTVARFALNTARYNLPQDYYATYLEKLNAVTAEDIQAMAQKYITPDNAHILVVGNKSEVADNLKELAADGEINFYDPYGIKLEIESSATANMTPEQILNNYVKAIGGKEKLMAVKDLTMNMEADAMGQKIQMNLIQKAPGKIYQAFVSPMGKQETFFDGEKGTMSVGGQSMPLPPEQITNTKEQAVLFTEMRFNELGYKAVLSGVENVDGKNAFVLETESPSGKKATLFFDVKTFLKIKESSSVKTPNGQVQTISSSLSDYREVDGILFPFSRKLVGGAPIPLDLKITEIKVNTGVKDDFFSGGK
jgi:predicted Zn-dependent peptidase